MAAKRKNDSLVVYEGSGNVFADLRVASPEAERIKAQLASYIRDVIRHRKLTQRATAKLMGVEQPEVSALLDGRLGHFSSERLLQLLTALGQDVEIAIKPAPRRKRGRITVTVAEEQRLVLSGRDRKAFFDALTDPPKPSERLVRALAGHKRLTKP